MYSVTVSREIIYYLAITELNKFITLVWRKCVHIYGGGNCKARKKLKP